MTQLTIPANTPAIESAFWAFHEAHPEVYEELRGLARAARVAGNKRIAIKTLYEVVRWRAMTNRLGDRVYGPDRRFLWAVGLFEGEGCFFVGKATGGRQARVMVLSSTDIDVVERFHEIVGVGKVYPPKPRKSPKHKPLSDWRCSRWLELRPLIDAMLPHLCERRAQSARRLLDAAPERVFRRPEDGPALDPGRFKLNNNYTAYYSRLLAEREPELRGVFETRRLGVPSHVLPHRGPA